MAGKELNVFFGDLLESRTALDATQADSLKILLAELPLPAVGIKMKETLMLVIDTLVEQDRAQEAQIYFSAPNIYCVICGIRKPDSCKS